MPRAEDPSSRPALTALRIYLESFEQLARQRGRSCFNSGHVVDFWHDGDTVEGTVSDNDDAGYGSVVHETAFFWHNNHWMCECTCRAKTKCKHAYAVGCAWLGEFAASLPSSLAKPAAGASTAARKPSFREQWKPVIEKKLGRVLDEDEARALGRLSALFQQVSVHYGQLSTYQMDQHGFTYSPQAVSGPYQQLYEGWWDSRLPPADPWALWQYIAYDWERSGREIPEVFRPMTDTAKVRTALEDRLLQREIAEWHRALNTSQYDGDERINAGESAKIADLRLRLSREQEGGFFIEIRPALDKPWRAPTQKWLTSLSEAGPADFNHLPAAAAALATALAAESDRYSREITPKFPLPERIVGRILAYPAAHLAISLGDGSPWRVEAGRISLEAVVSAQQPDRLELQLLAPDGGSAESARLLTSQPEPLYELHGRVFRGPPALPTRRLPTKALADPVLMTRFRAMGLRLPQSLELKVRHVVLRPVLRCWLQDNPSYEDAATFCAQLLARSDDPKCEQHWTGHDGWGWTNKNEPPPRGPDDPMFEFDLTAAKAVGAHFAEFKLVWYHHDNAWGRLAAKNFPEDFTGWHATLPPDLIVEASPELASMLGPPLRGQIDLHAVPGVGASRDWFDLTIELRVEDTTLTKDEIALLLKARGKWVRLPKHGWRRLELSAGTDGEAAATLDRLGLRPDEVFETGRSVTHRLHALQLAAEADSFARRDSALAAALRERGAAMAALPPPAIPSDLCVTLRPYQTEGFHFLTHLSANGFGGILADDMGLGKTVQTLAWLLHLSTAPQTSANNGTPPRPFRTLVVCPKSVMHGWLTETPRFAPSLIATAFAPSLTAAPFDPAGRPALLIANYAQLRLHAEWLQQQPWDVVVLDEAQFIKNPASQTAAIARTLPATHRLALTGTPIENRLLDLWSIFAFAQPGLLGTQASFRRLHADDDPAAAERLRRRARHFMLRRTKAQVATDLPPRTEDEIVVELEGGQRRLYEAELKRARAMLLGLATDRALDAVRFNILASLLRLRQICCHPALIDPAHHDLPSAKLEALLEQLEELRDEGHQVLVFSQFVQLLEIIRTRLQNAGIGHLILTGQTENRAELVEKFQSDRAQTVFLLSLKAAGFGLNLTAASYVILCDPWWNPAVEAQAIDRTHRIGQTRPVTAYRLLAADTIEQKIRALQKEKAALAASVVQEESLASVLDLDSLRQILG